MLSIKLKLFIIYFLNLSKSKKKIIIFVLNSFSLIFYININFYFHLDNFYFLDIQKNKYNLLTKKIITYSEIRNNI